MNDNDNGAGTITAVPVLTADDRSKAYEAMGRVHARMVEAQLQAKFLNKPMTMNVPALLIHFDHAISFLAEELLTLRKMLEEGAEAQRREGVRHGDAA